MTNWSLMDETPSEPVTAPNRKLYEIKDGEGDGHWIIAMTDEQVRLLEWLSDNYLLSEMEYYSLSDEDVITI